MSWLQIARMALELLRAVREKTQRTCPNPNCPLGLRKAAAKPLLSAAEQIRRQRELFRKNHTGKKP